MFETRDYIFPKNTMVCSSSARMWRVVWMTKTGLTGYGEAYMTYEEAEFLSKSKNTKFKEIKHWVQHCNEPLPK
jgi:hypothetical protein